MIDWFAFSMISAAVCWFALSYLLYFFYKTKEDGMMKSACFIFGCVCFLAGLLFLRYYSFSFGLKL